MPNEFGLFVNLDYAHKSHEECSQTWQNIMDAMLGYGFMFKKRAFVINTDQTRDEISIDVRHLFDEIQLKQPSFYSFIIDCYILNLESCNDLTLPDTSESIEVEDISLSDLNVIGVDYDLLFKQDKAK
ncbi:MAG: hypothetical protein OQL19_13220 [Gammaproteobacteria bacterium]|nr:hypothetical protein [Gammaproteobacteria bacterium]